MNYYKQWVKNNNYKKYDLIYLSSRPENAIEQTKVFFKENWLSIKDCHLLLIWEW